jgi:hypothetical protein
MVMVMGMEAGDTHTNEHQEFLYTEDFSFFYSPIT